MNAPRDDAPSGVIRILCPSVSSVSSVSSVVEVLCLFVVVVCCFVRNRLAAEDLLTTEDTEDTEEGGFLCSLCGNL